MIQSANSLQQVGHWQGRLELLLESRAMRQGSSKTVLASRRHSGPYTVQRPFYPEGDVCHLILLHPPGGLVEGDCLELRVNCAPGARALLTTPSAGKVYECSEHAARQQQTLLIDNHAVLEWFPQETILFDQAQAQLTTRIDLQATAQFAGWEIVCLGRPIVGDEFARGQLTQVIELYRNDRPLLLERTRITQDSQRRMAAQPWILNGYCVFATLIMTGATQEHLAQARAIIEQFSEPCVAIDAGVTLIDGVLITRALAQQSRLVKALFLHLWFALREALYQRKPCAPRIWST